MARTLLALIILLTLTGCPDQNTTLSAEQIAAYQAQLKEAQTSKSFWQTTATILGSFIILALIVGIVLGSKAKDDADER